MVGTIRISQKLTGGKLTGVVYTTTENIDLIGIPKEDQRLIESRFVSGYVELNEPFREPVAIKLLESIGFVPFREPVGGSKVFKYAPVSVTPTITVVEDSEDEPNFAGAQNPFVWTDEEAPVTAESVQVHTIFNPPPANE